MFDAPDHSESVSKRQETNTPLQALALLNDPTFVEASKVLGEQMVAYPEISKAIQVTFQKLTGRNPLPKELEILLQLRENEVRKFTEDSKKLKGWLNAGAYKINTNLDPRQVAANAVVASVIINSDAAITKR
jgi:hypothetical protein